jgi:hypothetical protein
MRQLLQCSAEKRRLAYMYALHVQRIAFNDL